MKYLLTVLLIFIFAVLYSCNRKNMPMHIKLIHKEMNIFTAKLERKNKFEILGQGGSMMDDISSVAFHCVDYEHAVNLKNARRLLINKVENFLEQINSSEAIRPFLHNYPFTGSNIQFIISIRNYCEIDGEDMISLVSLNKGKILYFKRNKKDDNNILIYKENYQEGLKIYKVMGL